MIGVDEHERVVDCDDTGHMIMAVRIADLMLQGDLHYKRGSIKVAVFDQNGDLVTMFKGDRF